jgi:hypothetical protein
VLILPMLLGAFRAAKDTEIQVVVTDVNVKRACMAAENVDLGAGHSKMLASSWFSAPGKTVAGPVV